MNTFQLDKSFSVHTAEKMQKTVFFSPKVKLSDFCDSLEVVYF